MPKYVAKRNEVCAGNLMKPINLSCKIFNENNQEISKQELEQRGITNFSISGGLVCRGMLFNVNENGLANDLIYNTPTNYPIEGIKSKIDVKSEFIIQCYVELEELLKYLNFGVDLTQHDINKIFRKLITHNWWLEHNLELFGWQKHKIGYSSGGIETIPMHIYDNLSSISCSKNGKPHREEPQYSLIKRR